MGERGAGLLMVRLSSGNMIEGGEEPCGHTKHNGLVTDKIKLLHWSIININYKFLIENTFCP
jgi:hypothetical protein